ncbi:hypothetical protein, partial [Staphylococcus lugdunensis]|uniref:hypothetical protein n=1 Tax=Staphylococcus lugdunensis TaxID=28035 RepID=UPI002555652C
PIIVTGSCLLKFVIIYLSLKMILFSKEKSKYIKFLVQYKETDVIDTTNKLNVIVGKSTYCLKM